MTVTREDFRDPYRVAKIAGQLQNTLHALSTQGNAYQARGRVLHANESFAKGMMVAHAMCVMLSIRIHILEGQMEAIEDIPQETLDFVMSALSVSLEAGTPYEQK